MGLLKPRRAVREVRKEWRRRKGDKRGGEVLGSFKSRKRLMPRSFVFFCVFTLWVSVMDLRSLQERVISVTGSCEGGERGVEKADG